MRYLLNVRVDGDKKRVYPIDANDELQAKARLMTRLPPHQRDSVVIDDIKIDPASIVNPEIFGVFGGE